MRRPALLLLPLLALACRADPVPDPPADDDDDDDVTVHDDVIGDVQVQPVGMVPTVLSVRWTTDRPAEGRVCFDQPGVDERGTPWSGGDMVEHEAILRGLRPGQPLAIRVEARDGDQTWTADCGSVDVGEFAPHLPELTPSLIDPAWAAGGYTVTSLISVDSDWVVVLDPGGEIVWAMEELHPGFRAVLARDRASFWTNSWTARLDDVGWLQQVDWGGGVIQVVEVPGAHTDFVELEDGTLAVLAREVREFEDGSRRLVGDTLVEVAPDGALTQVWSLFDHVPVDLGVTWPTSFFEDDPDAEDWSHCNGLDHDPDRDAWLVSCAHHEAVYAVDRVSGELLWTLSAWEDDFVTPAEQMPIVAGPHAVQALGDDHVLVFNRGDVMGYGDWPADLCSQAVEIQVDTDAGEATVTWSHAADECFLVYCLGDAQRLWNGNTAVNWSTAGQIDEIAPDGEVVWRVNSGFGFGFGFSSRVQELY